MKSLVISLSILFMCAGVSYAGDWIYADLTWDDSPDQVMEKLKKNAADVCWSVKKSGSPRRSLIGLGALVTREHESALWSRGTVFNKGPLWQYYEHVINNEVGDSFVCKGPEDPSRVANYYQIYYSDDNRLLGLKVHTINDHILSAVIDRLKQRYGPSILEKDPGQRMEYAWKSDRFYIYTLTPYIAYINRSVALDMAKSEKERQDAIKEENRLRKRAKDEIERDF